MARKRKLRANDAKTRRARHTSGPFDAVPSDVAKWILSFLTDTRDVLSARTVCKRWDLIVMNPRPVVARVAWVRDFVNAVKPIALRGEKTISFRLSEDALLAASNSREPQRMHTEARFNASTQGYARDVAFSLPVRRFVAMLDSIERLEERLDEDIRIVLFERVKRVVVLFSGQREKRFSSELLKESANRDYFSDLEYRLRIPFSAAVVASASNFGRDNARLAFRTAPAPECLRLLFLPGFTARRLLVFTIDVGNWGLQLRHNFVEYAPKEPGDKVAMIKTEDGEEHGLSWISAKRIGECAIVQYQPLLTVEVGHELFRTVCGYLSKLGEVTLCVLKGRENDKVQIVLERRAHWYTVRWAIDTLEKDS